MSYNNTPNGKCLTKNHNKYGDIYLNINSYNEYYLRTKNKGTINKYKLPIDLNNKDLKLFQAIKIIEDYNNKDIKIQTVNIIENDNNNIEIEQIKKEVEQPKINIKPPHTVIDENRKKLDKGKILGKIGNENVFLNHSSFNNKYYLRTSRLKNNIPIPKDIDVNNLTFDKAKNIIDLHIIYDNKLIGVRDGTDVILKNGQYGLYIIWQKQLFTLPKFILNYQIM